MPSSSDAQRNFFLAVLNCKTKGNCSSKLKKTADSMSVQAIKDFTKKETVSFLLSFKKFTNEQTINYQNQNPE